MKELQKTYQRPIIQTTQRKIRKPIQHCSRNTENNFFNESGIDEESLTEFFEMLDDETAEKLKGRFPVHQ